MDSTEPPRPSDLLDRITALDAGALDDYRRELADSGVLAAIERAQREFEETVRGQTDRGDPYGFGGIKPDVGVRLYRLVRELRPAVAVETGVCNGVSTALILAGLARNGEGVLYSIDYPEVADTTYPEGSFWHGKKGAVIPRGSQSGWLVPPALRARLVLTIGRTRDELPPLLSRLGVIDFFLHDSEHSEECMRFEYEAAWPHLRPGGVLVSDDITWNTVFDEFPRRVARAPLHLRRIVGLLIK
jgi:predicted O-methyltransferase YrrM